MDINSPMGRMKMAQQSKKVLTVSDESEEEAVVENEQEEVNELEKLRNLEVQKKQEKMEKQLGVSLKDMLSPGAKKRIEMLAGLGRMTDTLTVEGIAFKMQSLKTNEQKDVFADLFVDSDNAATSTSYKNRVYTLARAVTHIDGTEINLIVGSDDPKVKSIVFFEMDDNVTEYMYKWYQENIVKKSRDKFKLSKEEVKEVADEIKIVKEPDHRFYGIYKTFHKTPSDKWFEEIDPFMYLWMYESWVEDLNEENKFARNYSILTGSFSNMDLAQKMMVEKSGFSSSDDDFEKTTQMIESGNFEKKNSNDGKAVSKRRRRRVVK